MSATAKKAPEQYVTHECPCGHKGGAYVSHYDIVQCGRCGSLWWALQPNRGGPLVAFARVRQQPEEAR